MKQITKSNKTLDQHFGGKINSPKEHSYVNVDENVRVTVWPEFVDNRITKEGDLYIWAYQVKIDNRCSVAIKVLGRSWKIIDEKGFVQEVKGDSVVGEQPVIEPGASFQYTSGVHLKNPSGIMMGSYDAKKLSTDSSYESFSIKIPTFSLDVPGQKQVIN